MEEKPINVIVDEFMEENGLSKSSELRFVIFANVRVNPGTKTYVCIKGTLIVNKKEALIIEFENGKKWDGDTLCISTEIYELKYLKR